MSNKESYLFCFMILIISGRNESCRLDRLVPSGRPLLCNVRHPHQGHYRHRRVLRGMGSQRSVQQDHADQLGH